MDVRFRVLGGFEVLLDGRPVAIPAGKQRAVLAVLLATGGLVSRSRLIDELWNEDPPQQAVASLQMHVSRLRRTLGQGAARLRTEGTGYVLDFERDEVDGLVFETAVAAGRDLLAGGEAEAARARLGETLEAWSGDPYAGVEQTPAVAAAVARLTALRVEAEALRIDAELALGHHEAVLSDLQPLVRREPLNERFRGQLMLALYRSGRQADALEVYRDTRTLFVEQLGLEPSEDLQRLERAILQRDQALAAPPASGPRLEQVTARSRPRRRRGRWRLAGVVALAVAACAAAAVLLLLGGAGSGASTVSADSVSLLDASGHVTGEFALGSRPVGIALDEGRVWVATGDGHLIQADGPRVSEVTRLALDVDPSALAASGASVWVAEESGELDRVDASAQRVVQRVRVGNGPVAIAAGFGSVWVANAVDGTLMRVDAGTGAIVAAIPVGSQPAGVAVGDGAVWVTDAVANTLLRVDPGTDKVDALIQVGGSPSALAVADGTAWAANTSDGTVSRVDLRSNVVTTTVPVCREPDALAVTGGRVWVACRGDQTLARIDARTNRIEARTQLEGSPELLATRGGQIAVATYVSPAAHRGGTLRLVGTTGGDPITPDPATWYAYIGWSLLATTNDGLVAYRHAGGTAGVQVVPDLARSLPLVADGGRTYTFQLRAGLRYSDGRPVRARDVLASIERLWKLGSPVTQYPDLRLGLVGENNCVRRPAHCDLSAGITTDAPSGTVTFHLLRPIPSFLRVLALPFYDVLPAGTPAFKQTPLPATGPYQFSGYVPGKRLELVRNRTFRVWSADAQPDGYPDRIEWTITKDDRRALRDVLSGRADYLVTGVPTAALATLAARDAAQVRANDEPWVRYLFLNTRVPPFDNASVRRALNLAIDRRRVVDLAGGPLAARPTCQVLPPGFPGYEPSCPYTLDPTSAGTWTAPDQDAARALLRRTHMAGMRVVVLARSDSDWPGEVAVGRYLVRLLDDLGFRASLRLADSSHYYALVGNSRNRAQIGLAAWLPDVPDASNFFQPLLTCSSFQPHSSANANVAEFCNRSIDADIRRAQNLERSDPAAANQWWTVIDHRIGIAAPWVPLYTERWTDLVSRRVGNFEFNPALGGLLLDQAWVR